MGAHEVAQGVGAQARRAQGRRAGYDPVEERRRLRGRGPQVEAAHRREVEAAHLRKHVDRVGGIGRVRVDSALDHVALARERDVREPRAAPDETPRVRLDEHCGHRRRGGRVADAHLARGEKAHAGAGKPARDGDSDLDRAHGPIARHSGAVRDVAAPPPHVRAHHARVFYAPGHTHVDGHDLGTRERCHAAGARGPLAHVARDGSRHVLPALRHAFGNDPVVGEEYRERAGELGHLGAPLSCGDTRDGVFKVAQSPQGVRDGVPRGVRGGAGAFVCRRDPGKRGFEHGARRRRERAPDFLADAGKRGFGCLSHAVSSLRTTLRQTRTRAQRRG